MCSSISLPAYWMISRILFLYLLLTLFFLENALSCECPSQSELGSLLEQASLVFSGRVKELKQSQFRPGYREVQLSLITRIKGGEEVRADSVVVYTADSREQCGFSFSSGKDYLVFATGSPAFFRTTACLGTRELENALYDVQLLMQMMRRKNRGLELRNPGENRSNSSSTAVSSPVPTAPSFAN